ncbi:sugar ABC transporter permease [Arenibaculum sp.]|uniref:carbohydrate ABC transporter permease n=1 Tax=Arenibaculum sp. TaxID=2865862 RepID=UPI002E10BB4D|nr:sugar ABC transporter permease [Arenibaculum sp.]
MRGPSPAFAAPALLMLGASVFVPLLAVAAFSLTDYRLGYRDLAPVGADNYASVLADPGVLRAVANSALYFLLVTPLSVLGGLAAAIAAEGAGRWRPWLRAALFVPYVSLLVAMGVVWELILHPSIGPVNGLLAALGLSPQAFLADPDQALWVLCAIGVWQQLGFNMVLFSAALQAVPSDLLEAAALDGVPPGWERAARIMVPLLGRTAAFALLATAVHALQVFDLVAVLTRGGPAGATEVMLYAIWREGFSYFDIGRAAAMTVVLLGPLALLCIAYWRLVRRAGAV